MRFTAVGGDFENFLDRDTHMTTVPTLSTVSFIFTDATLQANTGIPAPPTGSLAIAALLALPASLAARFG